VKVSRNTCSCFPPAEPFAFTFAPLREWLYWWKIASPSPRTELPLCEVLKTVRISERKLSSGSIPLPAAPAYSVAPSPKATIGYRRVRGSALGGDASANSVTPFTGPLFEGSRTLIRNFRFQRTKNFCRTTRNPPARVVLLLGRCRFVTASIFQFCLSKFAKDLSGVGYDSSPSHRDRAARAPTSRVAPLRERCPVRDPLRGRGSSFKYDFQFIAGVRRAIY
jgi:hypothetical protein